MAARQGAPGRRRFLPSVRLRATFAAVVVVGLVTVIGALFGFTYLRAVLTGNIETTAERRAEAIVASLEAGAAPVSFIEGDNDGELIQILDADNKVVTASSDLEDATAITPGSWPATLRLVEEDEERFVAVYKDIDMETGPLSGGRVVVALSLEDPYDAAAIMARVVIVAIPALIAFVGVMTWWLVGRSLRPIDRMRTEVEEVSATSLDRRIPDPGGHDEVARLAATMNHMLTRLESSAHAQRRFISDASHELRSPLAAIRQNAEVARAYPDRLSGADLAETTLAETLRMQRLVEAMLLLSRSDEDRLRVHNRPVDLDDVVLAEAHRLRSATSLLIDASGVGPARVIGDEGLLSQVARNLCDNAVRHAASTVTLAVRAQGGWVVLDVDDDGAGVDPSDRAKVFDRFVRLDEARARDDGGSGLGLAIVHEIVSAHRGSVDVAQAPTGGARFRVTIPEAS